MMHLLLFFTYILFFILGDCLSMDYILCCFLQFWISILLLFFLFYIPYHQCVCNALMCLNKSATQSMVYVCFYIMIGRMTHLKMGGLNLVYPIQKIIFMFSLSRGEPYMLKLGLNRCIYPLSWIVLCQLEKFAYTMAKKLVLLSSLLVIGPLKYPQLD